MYPVRLLETKELGGAVRVYYFEKPEGLSWREAEHIHLALPGFDAGETRDKGLVHHLSIVTLPEEGRVGFVTRLDSSDSRYKRALERMKPGDTACLFKPGNLLALRRDGRPVALLAMGVAADVLRPLALRLSQSGEGVPSLTALLAERGADWPFREEILALRAPGLSIRCLPDRESYMAALRALDLPGNTLYLTVGSDPFIGGCVRALMEKGIALADIVIDLKEEKRLALLERLGIIPAASA